MKKWLVSLLCILFLCGCGSKGNAITANDSFEVDFINVDQGDAALIMCNGHNMLIDCGDRKHMNTIEYYLKDERREIDKLDYIFCSHGDDDHIGGIEGAFGAAKVGKVYCSAMEGESGAYDEFLRVLGENDQKLRTPKEGEEFSLGKAKIEVLSVDCSSTNLNDSSIVLMVTYGNTKFLFTGDAEKETEYYLTGKYDDEKLKCNVLKVAHHGSKTSTTTQFANAVRPDYAVISVAEDNKYGHPYNGTIDTLERINAKVIRTDEKGNIIFTSDGETVSVQYQ